MKNSHFFFYSSNNRDFRSFSIDSSIPCGQKYFRYIDSAYNIYPYISWIKLNSHDGISFGTVPSTGRAVLIYGSHGMYVLRRNTPEFMSFICGSLKESGISYLENGSFVEKLSPDLKFDFSNYEHVKIFTEMLSCSLPNKLPCVTEEISKEGTHMKKISFLVPPMSLDLSNNSDDFSLLKINLMPLFSKENQIYVSFENSSYRFFNRNHQELSPKVCLPSVIYQQKNKNRDYIPMTCRISLDRQTAVFQDSNNNLFFAHKGQDMFFAKIPNNGSFDKIMRMLLGKQTKESHIYSRLPRLGVELKVVSPKFYSENINLSPLSSESTSQYTFTSFEELMDTEKQISESVTSVPKKKTEYVSKAPIHDLHPTHEPKHAHIVERMKERISSQDSNYSHISPRDLVVDEHGNSSSASESTKLDVSLNSKNSVPDSLPEISCSPKTQLPQTTADSIPNLSIRLLTKKSENPAQPSCKRSSAPSKSK